MYFVRKTEETSESLNNHVGKEERHLDERSLERVRCANHIGMRRASAKVQTGLFKKRHFYSMLNL